MRSMGINPGALYGLWAGQTAALFKVSPDQSGGTALPSTHFYLLTLNLEQSELPKQSIPLFLQSKHVVFCRSPKHCKSFSLAGNIQPTSLGNYLLSFPLHRLSGSHPLPLTVSTRSNFSGPNVSMCPWKLCCQGSGGAPRQPSAEHVLLLLLSSSSHGPGSPAALGGLSASAVLHSTAPRFWTTKGLQKNWLKPIFYLPAAV